MNLRFSLFSKIMLWFFLNLLILGGVFLLIFNSRSGPNSTSILSSANRIEVLTRSFESESVGMRATELNLILSNYSKQFDVEFFLFDYTGRQLAGEAINLPAEVFNEVARAEPPFPSEDRPLPPPPQGFPRSAGPPLSAYFTTSNPTLYWFVGRVMIYEPGSKPLRSRLIAKSSSFSGNGLFFNPTPYLIVAGIIIGFSVLFWLPLIRNITRAIREMTTAAGQIAEENFEVKVNENRLDELGQLGKSINHLVTRLSGFVHGQKRFLGDISHELNSPLARMQFALSNLEEEGLDEIKRAYVADVKEEVMLMSKLVSELLTYSKAGIKTTEIKLESVLLLPLIENVIARETSNDNGKIKLEIEEGVKVLANSELLSRALANIVRNALKYAGSNEIIIQAENVNNQTKITVADKGTGVPETELEKLFDPFHRVETDRARESGGTGLGLAIVKTCVEACQGKVIARNRHSSGLEIIITLNSSN